ncbi:MAG: S8 family serine peptidase [Coriobacteriales bacterium]|nr:S8 family serine peptidase [Coriobacteriales bacterium]
MKALRIAIAACLGIALSVPASAPAVAPFARKDRLAVLASRGAKQLESTRARMRAQLRSDRPKPLVQPPVANASKIDGLWIVGVEPGRLSSVAATVDKIGGDVEKTAVHRDKLLVKLPSQSQASLASRIRQSDGVEGVRQAVKVRALGETRAALMTAPADPQIPSQWGLRRIGMDGVWPVEQGSKEVTIAVVDTGVDLTHPDLAANLDTANDFDFVNHDPSANDGEGHGTMVAGIAAALANGQDGAGVAPKCTILPVRVLGPDGEGSDFDVAQGIMWAADHGASVINLSLGTWAPTQELVDAVEYAQSKDIAVVAAAGNGGFMSDEDEPAVADVDYPGALPGVLTVGASTMNDTVVSWSSKGPEVDLVAPGTNILTTRRGGGMIAGSGTSMSTPMVAAAVALVRSAHPEYSAQQAIDVVTSGAVDLGRSGRDIQSGFGRLNVAAAFGLPGGTESTPPEPTDDDAPGIPLPGVATTGTLDTNVDAIDVYKVHLDGNQQLDASIKTASGSAAELYLFDPLTTSVYSSGPIFPDSGDGMYEMPSSSASTKVTYVAPRAGDFYLVASSVRGKGAYTITATKKTAAVSDNRLPGIELPASPVKGGLDEEFDPTDVYRVHLDQGERIAVRLTGATGSAAGVPAYFAATLYDADTWSLSGGYPEEIADWMSYPGAPSELAPFMAQGFQYEAPKTGDYYIEVCAEEGFGPYTLTWKKITLGPDDEIPGTPLPSSPVTGTLDQPFELDDVYRVHLDAGQQLNLQLTGANASSYHVGVFAPTATTIWGYWAAAPPAGGYPQAVSYVAPESGDYYVDVYAYAGTGAYSLRWSITDPRPTELTSSVDTTRPAFGQPVNVSARVTEPGTTTPVSDQAVGLQIYMYGWETIETVLTDSDGRARFSMTYPSLMDLRVVTLEGWDESSIAAEHTVKPRSQVTAPKASAKVLRGKTLKWSGKFRPHHTSRLNSVNLRFYKLVNGTWRLQKTVPATNVNPPMVYSEEMFFFDEPDTQYAAFYKIPSAGKWRITAHAPEDESHSGSNVATTYVTVR